MVIVVILINKTECTNSIQREDNDSLYFNAAPSFYWTVQVDVRVRMIKTLSSLIKFTY